MSLLRLILFSFPIVLLVSTVVANATPRDPRDINCTLLKVNKLLVNYRVDIALNWNKESDPSFTDKKKMKPGYIVVVTHKPSFSLFKENTTVTDAVNLLIQDNIFQKGTFRNPLGLMNVLAKETGVLRVSSFNNARHDQTVKLNAAVSKTHHSITILGVLRGRENHFYGTAKPVQLCRKNGTKIVGGRLPKEPLTAYKLVGKKPMRDNNGSSTIPKYGTYIIEQGRPYPNLVNECFPKTAKVGLENGRSKYMGVLKVGDRVAVGGGKYSTVFMFTHKLPHVKSAFVQLTTTSGNTLKLTPGHFIPVNGYQYKPAREVRMGDTVRLANGSTSKIIDIRTVEDTGLYNPQTTHGDIVVEGVVASTYTVAIPPKMAHAILAPIRGIAARFAAFRVVDAQTMA